MIHIFSIFSGAGLVEEYYPMLKTAVKSLRFFRFFAQRFTVKLLIFSQVQAKPSEHLVWVSSQTRRVPAFSTLARSNMYRCWSVCDRKEHLCCFPGMGCGVHTCLDSTWQKALAGRALPRSVLWPHLKLLQPWFFYFFFFQRISTLEQKFLFLLTFRSFFQH